MLCLGISQTYDCRVPSGLELYSLVLCEVGTSNRCSKHVLNCAQLAPYGLIANANALNQVDAHQFAMPN